MALIVDGMNVIGAVPDGWWRDRSGAMRRLLERLRALDRDDVVLVLDGRERDLGDPGPVTVRWAPHADDLIVALAQAGDTVVTSDRELAERVRAEGCQAVGARAFRGELPG
jgi:predicted RNA-binding protein with PIN domain